MVAKQYEWLVADLEAADRPENRSVRPWVVLMGHRPMYCSGVQGQWKQADERNHYSLQMRLFRDRQGRLHQEEHLH